MRAFRFAAALGVALVLFPCIARADAASPLPVVRLSPTNETLAIASASLALERVSDGSVQTVALPPNARITALHFSPDGKLIALANATPNGTDLSIVVVATAAIVPVPGIKLSAMFGDPIVWMPDGRHLIVRSLIGGGAAAAASAIGTSQHVLATPQDEALFDDAGTSQLMLVDSLTLAHAKVGAPGIFTDVSPSPSGVFLLVSRLHRPYSNLVPYERFPTDIEVLAKSGVNVATIAERPLMDSLPTDGVVPGPRDIRWKPNSPSTLAWIEALDGGDPRVVVPFRDRVMLRVIRSKIAPFEIDKTIGRATRLTWLANDDRAILREYDQTSHYTRTWLIDSLGDIPKSIGAPLRDSDRTSDRGRPMTVTTKNDDVAIVHDGNAIYVRGTGADGRRPFLDRLDLDTMQTTRLFQSALSPLDTVMGLGDTAATTLIIERTSPTMPPTWYVQGPTGDRDLPVVDPTR